MTGNAGITVSPAGAVTLNVAGTGQSSPIAIAGNGIIDDNTANDFTINYAGTGGISVAGNGNVTAILNAPNAAITQQGNGNWFGSIVDPLFPSAETPFSIMTRTPDWLPRITGITR